MLSHVSIRNFGAIDTLDVDLTEGFTAITGESGAGKSMFLGAMRACFLERVDKTKIRHGSDGAKIVLEFVFAPDHAVWNILKEHDLDADPNAPLIITRTIPRKGASRARVNGVAVTARDLTFIGAEILSINEQHAFLRFFDPNYARNLLDNHIEGACLKNVQQDYQAFKVADKGLKAFEALMRERQTRTDEVDFILEKLDALAPIEGEYETLRERRKLLQNSEKIASACMDAKEFAESSSAVDNFSKAQKALHKLTRIDALAENISFNQNVSNTIAALERSLIEYQEFEDALGILEDDCVFCPKDLDDVESRFQSYGSVARQIDSAIEDLPKVWDQMQVEKDKLGRSEFHKTELTTAYQATFDAWRKSALALSKGRKKIAKDISERLNKELEDLKMNGVSLSFDFGVTDISQPSDYGMDQICILVGDGSGKKGRPLEKAASGGELSRICLALCVVDAQKHGNMTLVFDEIDQGVNGAIAASIGQKLLELGGNSQVLAVTHSPQIAASAQAHIRIGKQIPNAEGSNISKLDINTRVEEIAALISGEKITQEARAAARKLLEAV